MSPQENSAAKWTSPIAGEGEKEHKRHTENQDKTGCYPNSVRSLFEELHLCHLGHQGYALGLLPASGGYLFRPQSQQSQAFQHDLQQLFDTNIHGWECREYEGKMSV